MKTGQQEIMKDQAMQSEDAETQERLSKHNQHQIPLDGCQIGETHVSSTQHLSFRNIIKAKGVRYDCPPLCQNGKIALKSLFHMIEEPMKGLTLGFQGQKN